MYVPSLDEAKRLAAQGNLVPVYREVTADLETPVSAYLKVARGGHSFLLESVEGGERLARYSFIGTEPYRVLRTEPNAALDQDRPAAGDRGRAAALPRRSPVPGLPRFHGGAVGYLSYEVVRHFEPRVPAASQADPLGLPEAHLHVHRHPARLRPPPPQDQGGHPRPPGRRHRGRLPAGASGASTSWWSAWRSP